MRRNGRFSNVRGHMSPDAASVSICGHDLGRPGHICAFFDSRAQEYDVLAPYFKQGLDHGEQVVTIVDSDRQGDHRRQLASRGIAVDDALAADDLKILTSEDTSPPADDSAPTECIACSKKRWQRLVTRIGASERPASWTGRRAAMSEPKS